MSIFPYTISHDQTADGVTVSPVERMQARLFSRYWVAAGSSLLVLLLMFTVYLNGYLSETGFFVTSGSILFLVVLFYALFRFRLNQKAADPSLTIPQVLCSILVLTVAMYYTQSSARPMFLPIVLMAFVFGVFRLSTLLLFIVAMMASGFYAVMIGMLLKFRPQDLDLRLELLRLIIFAIVILWFAVMGGYVSRLRKRLHESKLALEDLAIHDALTGSFNRHHMSNLLAQEKSRSDRSGGAFCIALLDLDLFKLVNDKYGHQVGDEVLKACATCGMQSVRPIDCFSRYGGEEFEVLLTQTDLQGAQIVAERIRIAVSSLRFPNIDPNLRVTVSIGLSQYRLKERIEDTERRADTALYRAKAAGRDRIEKEFADAAES